MLVSDQLAQVKVMEVRLNLGNLLFHMLEFSFDVVEAVHSFLQVNQVLGSLIKSKEGYQIEI